MLNDGYPGFEMDWENPDLQGNGRGPFQPSTELHDLSAREKRRDRTFAQEPLGCIYESGSDLTKI